MRIGKSSAVAKKNCRELRLQSDAISLSDVLSMILGAFVIGTTSTKEKADKAKASGADEVIIYSDKDFVEEVNRITESAGVNVIYDGVGKATFDKGKLCLKTACVWLAMKRRGLLVKIREHEE